MLQNKLPCNQPLRDFWTSPKRVISWLSTILRKSGLYPVGRDKWLEQLFYLCALLMICFIGIKFILNLVFIDALTVAQINQHRALLPEKIAPLFANKPIVAFNLSIKQVFSIFPR